MTAADEETIAVPASRVWCVICRTDRPYRNRPLHPASSRRRPGLNGDDLVCCGCGTVLLTAYAPPSENEGEAA